MDNIHTVPGYNSDANQPPQEPTAENIPLAEGVSGNANMPLESRIAELEAELEQQKEQVAKFREEVLRKAADFENFRRQKEREITLTASRAFENVIRDLLPLVDDIRRLLHHAPPEGEAAQIARPYIEGVEMVQKNLEKWLNEKGVVPIESKGMKLDVNFHEAISQMEHPDAEADTVIEEYQTGYLLGDKVIRHAKVIVAR